MAEKKEEMMEEVLEDLEKDAAGFWTKSERIQKF